MSSFAKPGWLLFLKNLLKLMQSTTMKQKAKETYLFVQLEFDESTIIGIAYSNFISADGILLAEVLNFSFYLQVQLQLQADSGQLPNCTKKNGGVQ